MQFIKASGLIAQELRDKYAVSLQCGILYKSRLISSENGIVLLTDYGVNLKVIFRQDQDVCSIMCDMREPILDKIIKDISYFLDNGMN